MSVLADTNPSDPYLGRLIDGKYLVEQLVGTGAMGVVYRAKQVSLNKRVAVKILRRSLLGDPTVTLRFKQEARAASRLNHPNAIQILDFGELPEIGLYMVMEYVEGRDLGKVIQQDLPLSPPRLVHIMKQTLSALDEAHGVGIIHRDIKPANILVCNLRLQPDFVKVLDFGIAKILNPDPSESVPMTRDGFVCGTPAFMSPEQVQGLTLDQRTDLFSLGIVMYQCLTGKLPFEAASAVEMATQIVLKDPLPPREARPEWTIPPVLEAVVMRAMHKVREQRFQSAGEMLAALEHAESTHLDGHEATAPEAREGAPGGRHPAVGPAAMTIPTGLPSVLAASGHATGGAPAGPAPPQRAVVGLPFPLKSAVKAAPPLRAEQPPAAAPLPASPHPAGSPSQSGQADIGAAERRVSALDVPASPEEWTDRRVDGSPGVLSWRRRGIWLALGALVLLGGVAILAGKLVGGWSSPLEPTGAQSAAAPDQPATPPLDTTSDGAGRPGSAAPGDVAPASAELADALPADPTGAAAEPRGPGAAAKVSPTPGKTSSRPVRGNVAAGGKEAASPPARPRQQKAGRGGEAREAGSDRGGKLQRANELHAEGLRLMRRTDWEGALRHLREAAALAPGLAVLQRDMGRISMRLGQKAQAVGYFKAYLALAPQAPDAETYRTIIDDFGTSP